MKLSLAHEIFRLIHKNHSRQHNRLLRATELLVAGISGLATNEVYVHLIGQRAICP